ncbi:DUF4232 domain-containing protein [Streptomyces sp. NPDC053048]|uniref:DUF4232 domain-containing protein n=1 Tax=Streptomyces sp. NPDC053048 TaxID=3365694 RepID=UPI0037D148EB
MITTVVHCAAQQTGRAGVAHGAARIVDTRHHTARTKSPTKSPRRKGTSPMRTNRTAAAALTGATALALALTGLAATTAGAAAGKAGPTCVPRDVTLTVHDVQRPINHQLITVTNTSSRACVVHGAPHVSFDKDTRDIPVFTDSQPGPAFFILQPGDSAYAGLRTSSGDGSGTHLRTVKSLSVGYDDGNGSTKWRHSIPEVKGTVVDSAAAVTYWNDDPAAALGW